MKSLFLNPRDYEIELILGDLDDDCSVATVHFSFYQSKGVVCLGASEADRIGKWFLALAKEIKKT
jgi:hypothetical protein